MPVVTKNAHVIQGYPASMLSLFSGSLTLLVQTGNVTFHCLFPPTFYT